MSAIVDSPGWRDFYREQYECAEAQWWQEEEFLGPRRVEARRATEGTVAEAPETLDLQSLPPLLTLSQTAQVLGKTRRAVEAMLYRNELPSRRVGKRSRRIVRDELFRQIEIEVTRGQKSR